MPDHSTTPRCWAEVDLGAILHNAREIRRAAGPSRSLLAVIKADAYGHGAARVAAALRKEAEFFGVASVAEAAEVRGLGPDVLLLSPCLPAERAEAVRHKDIVTVSSAAEAAAYAAHGPCRVNFKVDTGMGRLGCLEEAAAAELAEIARLPGVTIHSVSTHLPSADCDPAFTRSQLERFDALRPLARELAPGVRFHALNSAGVFGFTSQPGDIVRAGLALCGCASPPAFQNRLRPALAWKTRVVQVRSLPAGHSVSYGRTFITPRPMRVAILAAGYADGYPRQASNRGAEVLIAGVRRPVLGRVTMDLLIVGADAPPEVAVEDEAVLMGQQGGEEITAAELAERAQTIPWHILTGISARTRRLWKNPP
ncbi:MAG: alanine racemase [Terrimicrobiaceae bacterium]|nr:alanine racemase [Terrimicrobiaceae bacterium]